MVAVVIGALAGLASGLFGIGGGLVIVPGLVLLVGISQRRAVANSLGAVIPIASAAAIPFVLGGHVHVLLAASMALTAVAAARYGARLMRSLSESQLTMLFALLMLVVALRMFLGIEPVAGSEAHDVTWIVGWGLVIGSAVGLVSPILGIGGGLIMVPAMVLALGIPQHLAEGTSLIAIVPTALSGTLAQRKANLVSVPLVAALGVGGVAGGLLGAAVALQSSPLALQRALAILLVLTLARLVWPFLVRRGRRAAAP